MLISSTLHGLRLRWRVLALATKSWPERKEASRSVAGSVRVPRPILVGTRSPGAHVKMSPPRSCRTIRHSAAQTSFGLSHESGAGAANALAVRGASALGSSSTVFAAPHDFRKCTGDSVLPASRHLLTNVLTTSLLRTKRLARFGLGKDGRCRTRTCDHLRVKDRPRAAGSSQQVSIRIVATATAGPSCQQVTAAVRKP